MKSILGMIVMIFGLQLASAQESKEITWFGVDFSKARMVGSEGFTDPSQIQSFYLNEWNSGILSGPDKYIIARSYRKPSVKVNLDVVNTRNNKVMASSLVTDNPYSLSESDATDVVKAYKGIGFGTGLVFVVESFSKTAGMASIYVALFDIPTGKVIRMKKLSGTADGSGFRNYWLGAITNVMKQGL